MKQQGKFILLSLKEFAGWLKLKQVTRQITLIQNHHTYQPNYSSFEGNNHFQLLIGMESYHIHCAGMAQIAQNFTIFPDGLIAVCRDLNTSPAGIYGANSSGICIESVGNFDVDHDQMTEAQKDAIIGVNALLCLKFDLPADTNSIVYHHWFDLDTGRRTNGSFGNVKTCPGTNFFGGNTVQAAKENFIPLIIERMVAV